MSRRELLALATGAAAVARGGLVHAQRAPVHRIGFLSPVGFAAGSVPGQLVDAVARAAAQQGLALGDRVEIVKRGAEAHNERLPALMPELLAAKVDVVAATSYPVALAAKQATQTVPIVTVNTGDPVRTHYRQPQPTGREHHRDLGFRRRAGAKMPGIPPRAGARPEARRDAVERQRSRDVAALRSLRRRGERTGPTVQSLGVREPDEFADAFAAIGRNRPDAS